MPRVKVGEENGEAIELYYEDHGSGRPIVLIHGFPLNGASWEKQSLALLANGYRVITYDRRGFGISSQPSFGYDYDTFAADLDALIVKLDLQGATLAGFSMGCGEVVRFLASYGSGRVSKAVCIAPVPPFLLQTEDNPHGAPQALFDGFIESIRGDRFAFLTGFFQNFYNLDVNLGSKVSEETVRANWTVAAGASATGTAQCVPSWLTDFRTDATKIDVPTLIIQGDQDRILPLPITGQALDRLVPNSSLKVIESAPHGLLWTHAAEVNTPLLEFLAG